MLCCVELCCVVLCAVLCCADCVVLSCVVLCCDLLCCSVVFVMFSITQGRDTPCLMQQSMLGMQKRFSHGFSYIRPRC